MRNLSTKIKSKNGKKLLAEKFTDYKDVPLLICHGDADNVIPFKRSRMTLHFLQSLDFDYLYFKKYRGLKHRIDKKVTIIDSKTSYCNFGN
jgi:hypothetical protein